MYFCGFHKRVKDKYAPILEKGKDTEDGTRKRGMVFLIKNSKH